MIDNYNALSGLVIGVLSLLALCYIALKQSVEISRPRDWLSGLRWQIFLVIVVSIIGLAPSLMYQYFRTIGIEADVLRNIATITGNVSRLANVILLLLIFSYKKNGD